MGIESAQTCPLCAAVDDPAGMVSVEIERVFPPASVMTLICRACAWAIYLAVSGDDDAAPIQGVQNDSRGADSSSGAASVSDSHPAAGAVVLQNQPGDEATRLNRPEPAAVARRESQPAAERDLAPERGVNEDRDDSV